MPLNFNCFPANKFCSLDQDQAWQNIWPGMILTVWQSDGIPEIFFENVNFEKKIDDKKHTKIPNMQR